MRNVLALILVLSLAVPVVADVTLVNDGRSDYEIVIPTEPTRVVTLAAQELQHFVEQSTGVQLPIVKVASPGEGHVYLGPNPASEAAGITVDDLQPEGYHLRTIGRDLHIVGEDTSGDPKAILVNYPVHCGTLSGVYDLLESYAGVVFAWHDDLGTVVPERREITIPELDLTRAPSWMYRTLAYGPENATYQLYGRRLRLGARFSMSHSHAWFRILPAEQYGQDHPEYYALVNGERTTTYYLGHHGGQLCTSNPDVIRLTAQAAMDFFEANPDRAMFSISPNDGGGYCQCDNCRALDGGDYVEGDLARPVLTDRLLHFYNAVAELVAEAFPDKYLGAYMYADYVAPPKREQVHPNLFLLQATNSAMGQGRNWDVEKQWEQQWTAVAPHFGKYDIYYYGPPSLHIMAPVTTHLIEKLQWEQQVGLCAGYLYIGQSYEQLGAGHYIMAHLMWDGAADARDLERRFYDGLYGPAGPDVLAYYHLLEDRLRKVYLEGIDIAEPAVANETKRGAQIVAAYWPILDQASALIAQAQGRELSEVQGQRLQRLIDHHELLLATVRGMIAAGRLEGAAQFNPDDVAMLKSAVETREAVRERIAAFAPTLAEAIAAGDEAETARISATGAFYRLSQNTRPLTLTAVATDKPIAVDGLGDEAVWAQAPAHYFLMARSAGLPSLGAEARLAWDAENLYVCVEGREEDPGKLMRAATARDDMKLFDEDGVEVFVQPPGSAKYYQLALGAGGAFYDGANQVDAPTTGDANWDSQAQAVACITADGWSAEFAIPFASMGARPEATGQWRINVCRTRRGNPEPDEYTAVAPTFSGYQVPGAFAPLVLAPAGEAGPALFYGTFDDVPEDDPIKRVRAAVEGGATVELTGDGAFCGTHALHFVVPEGGMGSVTLEAPVEADRGYRILLVHRNQDVTLNSRVRPMAPITRVICRGPDGQAVTETADYSWDGAPALDAPGRWRPMAHVFTTAPGTTRISFTAFFQHPGQYWLDEVRIEPL